MPAAPKKRRLADKYRYISLDGVSMSVADAAAAHGLSKNTLLQRLCRGWTVEKAVQPPTRPARNRGAQS